MRVRSFPSWNVGLKENRPSGSQTPDWRWRSFSAFSIGISTPSRGFTQVRSLVGTCAWGGMWRFMAGVVLDDGVEVGDRTVLYPQVYVGRNCRVGSECVFYSNVSIYHDVEIGNRVIIHSGSVLGSDGYGYARREDGGHEKMPHTGRVVVEDDVEIGALSAVDRATLEETRIGQGTKIDNLVQVAHNAKIGENCLLLGQAGMAGSSSLGQGVTVAARSGVGDHVHIGDRAILTALTAVNRDVQPDSLWAAARIPRPFVEHMKLEISLGKVPQALKTLDDLEKRLTDLEGKITGEFHDQAED